MRGTQEGFTLLDQIRQNREFARILFQAVPDLVFLLDKNGTFLDLLSHEKNPILLPGGQWAGKQIGAILPGEIAGQASKNLRETFETGQPGQFEYALKKEAATEYYECRIFKASEQEALCMIRDITEAKRASIATEEQTRKRLKAKRGKLQSLMESISDGIGIFDPGNSRLMDCNVALARLCGREKEEIIGLTALDYSPEYQAEGEHSQSKFIKISKDIHQYAQARTVNWRFRKGDGEVFDSEMVLSPIVDSPEGYWLGIIRDISQRKKQEEELARSKDLYRAIAHNLPDSGVMIFDRDLRFLLSEGAALELQGFTKEIMEGKTVFEVLPEDVAPKFAEIYQKVLAGEEITQENRHNGRIYDTRILPLRDESSEIYAGMIVSQDVTEKRQLAEAIETVSHQIAVPSEDLFFQELAKGLALVFGVDHVLIGEFEHEDKLEQVIAAAYWCEGKLLDRYVYNPENTPCEPVLEGSSHIFPSEVQRWFPADAELRRFGIESYAGVPLLDSSQQVIGLIALMDQTPMKDPDRILKILQVFTARAGAELERRKATRALQESLEEISAKNRELEKYIASNLELERFAYVASHDLREPLRNIAGFAQLLEKRYGSQFDNTAREYIGFITQGVRTMTQFIQDLLNYSRITSMESKFKKVATSHLIRQVEDNLDRIIETRDMQIHWQSLPDFLLVSETKILQVFQNLLHNALKFQSAGNIPVIHISAEERKHDILFQVKDNGIGISDAYFEKIFMPFRKLNAPDQYPGSGVGLAICKRIVEQHGGKIWLESTLGEGSTFFFTLKKNPVEHVALFP